MQEMCAPRTERRVVGYMRRLVTLFRVFSAASPALVCSRLEGDGMGNIGKSAIAAAGGLAASLAVASAAREAWHQNHDLTTSMYVIRSPKVPEEFDGFGIAHLSDLHNAEFGHDNAALLDSVSSLSPDIVAFTGDLLDYDRGRDRVSEHLMRSLPSIAPTYFVTGNHEHGSVRYAAIRRGMAEAGVRILDDDADVIMRGGASLAIAGIQDWACAEDWGREDHVAYTLGKLDGLRHITRGSDYVVLLAHRPELADAYEHGHVDLVLAGHAHGGQIRLPVIGGVFAPDQGFLPHYDGGEYDLRGCDMVVSRGLGPSRFPLRVNNKPELVYVTLRHV